MTVIVHAKHLAERMPPGLGQFLSRIPFTIRLGLGYAYARREIGKWERNSESYDNVLLSRLSSLISFAREKVPFYRELYAEHERGDGVIRNWLDWAAVPLVTKADLQAAPLEFRTARARGALTVNTGGTSGQPLGFMLDSDAFAREWAHMHFLWEAHGYRRWHLKLTFRGKHFDRSQVLVYNAVHNEIVVNASAPMKTVVGEVMAAAGRLDIRWLHGYPSLVSEFGQVCRDVAPAALPTFRSKLFGALLGSEYPAPAYRSVIEDVLTSNVVSWYGHSEMAVLARETSRGTYTAFPTYGYAEAVRTEGGAHRLVCTSLHNRTHPFIRYDTGDVVEPISLSGGALSYRISEGRVGDFLVDKRGNRHSLTAVIFGRHHTAFELVRHVQVRDDGGGLVTLVLTPMHQAVDEARLLEGFDLSDLDVDWRVEVVPEPVRTLAGKIQLKLPASDARGGIRDKGH